LSTDRIYVAVRSFVTDFCRLRNVSGDAENARHELAGHENARNAIVRNTECCTCLSIAEQECMSRQERAPDFAADCVLVND